MNIYVELSIFMINISQFKSEKELNSRKYPPKKIRSIDSSDRVYDSLYCFMVLKRISASISKLLNKLKGQNSKTAVGKVHFQYCIAIYTKTVLQFLKNNLPFQPKSTFHLFPFPLAFP